MLPTINQHVNPSVCLILPAYNKALEISPCIKGLVEQALSSSIDLHLVVVDDASSDGTSEQARKDYGAPVTVIRLDANSGKGGAIRAGSRFASTSVDYIGFFDADLDINPRALPDLVHAIESSHGAAGALASKAHPLSTVHRSLLRRAGSYVFSIITRISLGVPRMDTQTGAKLFRRDEFEKLMLVSTINGFAFDVELLAQASRARMRLVEAPVHLKPHTYSTLSIRNVARAFTDLWLVRSALKKGS